MDIFNASDEELKAELRKRALVKAAPVPEKIPFKIHKLEDTVTQYVEKGGFKDAKQYIFEEAIEAFYDEDVWKYLRTRGEGV